MHCAFELYNLKLSYMEISSFTMDWLSRFNTIALSMTMSSILKFRWINLFGALTFSTYGFLIGAWPVGFLNAFIALVDIYYLNSFIQKRSFRNPRSQGR